MEWAQKCSKMPVLPADRHGWEATARKAEASRDRLQMFMAFLAGDVKTSDAAVAEALMAFVHSQPGDPVSAQPSPDAGTPDQTTIHQEQP